YPTRPPHAAYAAPQQPRPPAGPYGQSYHRMPQYQPVRFPAPPRRRSNRGLWISILSMCAVAAIVLSAVVFWPTAPSSQADPPPTPPGPTVPTPRPTDPT